MLSDVLIPLRTQPVPETAEATAALLRLAATFATHVTLSPLEVSVPELKHRWSGAFFGLSEAGVEIERASREAASKLIASAPTVSGLEVSAQPLPVMFGAAPDSLTAAARHHDLAMLGYTEADYDAALAEALLFGTGRPTMLVPTNITLAARPFARIAVAWDGSEAASRALHDAMPLLVDADEVMIVNAPGDKRIDDDEIAGVTGYLARHGVVPTVIQVDIEVLDIGVALQHCATSRGVGLLVMGAFGHSRLQQFILGGATRGVLQNLRLPILMSH